MNKQTHTDQDPIPNLHCYLNLGTLQNLPDDSSFPDVQGQAYYDFIKASGFDGIQGGDNTMAHVAGLRFAAAGRINEPHELLPQARQWQEQGAVCATLHVGWGMEDDQQIDHLVETVIDVSAKLDFPLYIETHRATITQDNWRTVQITKRHPDVRFNGDFSHWYTGHEMVYGDFEKKLDFIEPVLERVRFIHGRIGNPGCMQVAIGVLEKEPYVDHFKMMWTAAMRGFIQHSKPGDSLIFAPELLHSLNYYARAFPIPDGTWKEESDRWQQALEYCRIARECFEAAGRKI